MLHELVARHAQSMLSELRDADPDGSGLPRYVERELRRFGATSAVAGCVCIAVAKPRVRVGLGALAAALYVVSLFLPAIVVLSEPILGGPLAPQALPGLGCLLWGWTAPHAWIANPLAAVAGVLHVRDRPRGAFVWAVLALIAAALSPVALGDLVVRIDVGYFLWVASMASLVLAVWRAKRALARDPLRV